jgi:signal transduction histidine kinase
MVDVDVDVDVDAEADLVAAIGAPSLQQIVLNLLINALQASPSGGRVAIEARPMRRERSGARGEQAMVKISLRDMGPGIPNDLQQQIFEPFFTTRGGRGGTGLGLFIASGIAREYGGWLEVQSEPGAGSVFSIHLPVERHDDSPSSDS